MRIAIYTRLSPNPNKKDTENQERDLKEFAARQGWEVGMVYIDIHVSGTKKGMDRPKFKQMMIDASRRKFDLVLFWSLDRLSREGVLATLKYLEQLMTWGVNWKSFSELYLDSCGIFKEAVISILATVAKQEKVRLVERTKAGIETARLKGKQIGRAKVGFSKEMILKLTEEGMSLQQIAEKLGIGTATVSRLRKEAYATKETK